MPQAKHRANTSPPAPKPLGHIIWIAPDRFDIKPDKSSWIEMGRCLRELGWTVTILTGRKGAIDETTETFGGIVEWVRATDLPFVFRFSLLLGMGRWLSCNAKADDVIIMNEDALWLVPHLRRLSVRFIHLDFRTLPVDTHRWKKRFDRFLFWRMAIKAFGRRVDGYSFITERLRRQVESEFSIGAQDHAIWHSGVNLDRFRVGPSKKPRFRDRFTLFYHGSISRTRGLGLVIDAIALGELPKAFQFVIVGDGPERIDLERQANALGLEAQIQFQGFVPYEDVVSEIANADVCICPLPDRLEWNVSSPLKVFEYMACGKPMILTPIPAHQDVLADSSFVVWTQGFEAADFSLAIRKAISHRTELARCAEQAPSVARDRFEWRVQAYALHQYLTRKRDHSSEIELRRQTE